MTRLIPHPDPRKAAKGFKVGVTDPLVPALPTPQPEPRDDPRRALIDEQPDFKTLTVSFNRLAVPDGTVITSQSAWLPLLDIEADKLGQEVVFNGVTVEMLSPDILGTFDADSVAWGSSDHSLGASAPQNGAGARIVVGVDLPVIHPRNPMWFNGVSSEEPQWNQAPYYHANFEPGDGPSVDPQAMFSMKFPAGKLTDTLPFDRILPKSFGLYGKPIGFGTRLIVALVLRRGTLNNVSGDPKYINGYCSVQVHLGLTRQQGQFNNKL